ncbi:hypothetical protein MSPP1_004154 [Malassezia sp. CBS 17886]|nr:hypothetical protein MSPP1_004154 [Malassezia sp. CBS 17886]
MSRAEKVGAAGRRAAARLPAQRTDEPTHDSRQAWGVAETPGERDHIVTQKALDDVLRDACASGAVALASRFPPLGACPPALFDLHAATAPGWHARAGDADAQRGWAERAAVHTLQLGENELAGLDERVGAFRSLRRLELQGNQLAALPRTLASLGHLSVLTLARNQLTHVPTCLLALDALTSLDLSHNCLESLWTDAQVAAARGAGGARHPLQGLVHLDVSGNRLRTGALVQVPSRDAPATVLALPPHLQRLHIGDNMLQGPLPLQLFSQTPQLAELALPGNDLGDAVFAAPLPSDGAAPVFPHLLHLDLRHVQGADLAVLEAMFASPPSVSQAEAKERRERTPVPSDVAPAPMAARLLVRVATQPSADDIEEVDAAAPVPPPLYVQLDAGALRTEPARRKRGGRGRGGDDAGGRGRAARDDHDDDASHPVAGGAGSALANAKLSTKKKEALGQVPCKFFRNNGCSAGDACPFAHTVPGEGQPKAVCQWYLKGSCRFGHRCALAHILPGQPMSMDRKNKRAAQQGATKLPAPADDARDHAEDEAAAAAAPPRSASHARTRPAGERDADADAAAPALDRDTLPQREAERRPAARGAGASLLSSSLLSREAPREADAMPFPQRQAWGTPPYEHVALDSAAPLAPTFGTSPFSYPGSHSVFFNNGTGLGETRAAAGTASKSAAARDAAPPASAPVWDYDPLSSTAHAEDFLPSSLSDLLTPAELKRRAQSTRGPVARGPPMPMGAAGGTAPVSQSLPAHAPDFGTLGDTSPPHVRERRGPAGHTRIGASGGGAFPGHGAAHSVHASPFHFVAAERSWASPTSVSPPAPLPSSLGGERAAAPFSSWHPPAAAGARAAGDAGRARGAPPVPISPSVGPTHAEEHDPIFELE